MGLVKSRKVIWLVVEHHISNVTATLYIYFSYFWFTRQKIFFKKLWWNGWSSREQFNRSENTTSVIWLLHYGHFFTSVSPVINKFFPFVSFNSKKLIYIFLKIIIWWMNSKWTIWLVGDTVSAMWLLFYRFFFSNINFTNK